MCRPNADILCGRPPRYTLRIILPFELKIGTTVSSGTFTQILISLRLLVFQLGASTEQTDGQTDGQGP